MFDFLPNSAKTMFTPTMFSRRRASARTWDLPVTSAHTNGPEGGAAFLGWHYFISIIITVIMIVNISIITIIDMFIIVMISTVIIIIIIRGRRRFPWGGKSAICFLLEISVRGLPFQMKSSENVCFGCD